MTIYCFYCISIVFYCFLFSVLNFQDKPPYATFWYSTLNYLLTFLLLPTYLLFLRQKIAFCGISVLMHIHIFFNPTKAGGGFFPPLPVFWSPDFIEGDYCFEACPSVCSGFTQQPSIQIFWNFAWVSNFGLVRKWHSPIFEKKISFGPHGVK